MRPVPHGAGHLRPVVRLVVDRLEELPGLGLGAVKLVAAAARSVRVLVGLGKGKNYKCTVMVPVEHNFKKTMDVQIQLGGKNNGPDFFKSVCLGSPEYPRWQPVPGRLDVLHAVPNRVVVLVAHHAGYVEEGLAKGVGHAGLYRLEAPGKLAVAGASAGVGS